MSSKFEKMSKKNLKMILTLMDEYIDRRGNPMSLIDYRNDSAIRDGLEVIGIEIGEIDLNFLTQLRKENPNFQTEEIRVPTLKVLEVVTERLAHIRVKEHWSKEMESYLDEDNLGLFISDMSDNYWWEGEKNYEETIDEETTSEEIIEVNKIN